MVASSQTGPSQADPVIKKLLQQIDELIEILDIVFELENEELRKRTTRAILTTCSTIDCYASTFVSPQ